MKVHPRPAVSPLGHNAGNQRHFAQVEFVRESLYRHRFHERVGDDDFLAAQGCGIAVIRGFRVRLKDLADSREFRKELLRS